MKKLIIGLCAVLTASFLGEGLLCNNGNENPLCSTVEVNAAEVEMPGTETEEMMEIRSLAEQAANPGALIRYDGKKYRYENNIKNYLVMGIDVWEAFKDYYEPGDAGHADSILLVSLNKDTKESQLIAIHRNTMYDVVSYDADGMETGSEETQICMQYGMASGNESSCKAMTRAVSDMLCNLPIDGYITLSGGGIKDITEELGGVDVIIGDDYTDINANFVEGEIVHMDGDLAFEYVHQRDTDVFDSATGRMKRQIDFMIGVLNKMNTKGGEKLYEIFKENEGSYILTNLTADEVKTLINYDYNPDQIEELPGQMIPAGSYDKYYLNQDLLEKQILRMFYVEQ